MVNHPRDHSGAEALNVPKRLSLFFVAERDRSAAMPGAACTADPMDIGFGDFRQVEIDDMGQLVDVDAGHDRADAVAEVLGHRPRWFRPVKGHVTGAVLRAVEANGGNWAAAARSLGMARSNLHHMAERLGLRK